MGFTKGMKRPKNAGRKLGTKNKKTVLIDRILEVIPKVRSASQLTALFELLEYHSLKRKDAPSVKTSALSGTLSGELERKS